jgi:hypothetical protein
MRGILSSLPEPIGPTLHVDPATAAHLAVATNVVATEAHKAVLVAGIGGAVAFSLGASVMLSAESEGYQKAGGVGLGVLASLAAASPSINSCSSVARARSETRTRRS